MQKPRSKLNIILSRWILAIPVFIMLTKGNFNYTLLSHWGVAVVFAALLSIVITAIGIGLSYLSNKYLSTASEKYKTFSKRPMNIQTIGMVFAVFVPIIVALYLFSYFVIYFILLSNKALVTLHAF